MNRDSISKFMSFVNKRYSNRILEYNKTHFPNNIFPPKILEDGTKIYLARFSNLYDLYEYLMSNPKLNKRAFPSRCSVKSNYEFAGRPYEEALNDLISTDYNPGYKEFLRLQSNLDNCISIPIHKYKVVNTLAGGHLNIPAYSSGNPLCYETEERIVSPKFVKINATVSYNAHTTKDQVFNRAIVLTNVLKALENAGYSIELNTFSLCNVFEEYMHIIYKIKNHGERLNMLSLYKVLCQTEFLRRIEFRVMETMGVEYFKWNRTYGDCCNEEKAKRILKLNDRDIYFDEPCNLGIEGKDIAEDFISAINHLNLENKIDTEKIKVKMKQNN